MEQEIMILDKITNFSRYAMFFPEIAGLIENSKMLPSSIGRHPINENSYLLISEYEGTSPDQVQFECHRRYIDVQLLIQGCEKLVYADVTKLETKQPYESLTDCELLEGEGETITLKAGHFVVFFPGEAHKPGLKDGNKVTHNRKIIFKIKYFGNAK